MARDTNPEIPAARMFWARQKFPVPWGLFIVLGIYALAVLGYVWATYWRSPEYRAAEHFAQADALLGLDDGRKASREQLEAAYLHLLEAARLVPRAKLLHDRVESLRWRFEERKFRMPRDLEMRAEAVAMLWQRLQQEDEPWLVVGARDRGWTPHALLQGPRTAVLWSIPGAVVLSILWAFWKYGPRRVKAQEHEADVQAKERELEALERARTRGSVDDAGRAKTGPKPLAGTSQRPTGARASDEARPRASGARPHPGAPRPTGAKKPPRKP